MGVGIQSGTDIDVRASWSGAASRARFSGQGFIFIPITKGKIVGSILISGEEIKARTETFSVTRRVTSGVSTASVMVANIKQQYTNKWVGGEKVEIYIDYVDGTTKIFEGVITNTKPIYNNRYPEIEISASDYGRHALDVMVFTKITAATDIGQIAADLVAEYLPSHTTANINTSTGITATPEWQGKPLWDCVKELVGIYGNNDYEFYVDFDKDWHLFQRGSRVHGPTEGIAIVYGQNLINTNVNDRFVGRKNKITVIGQSVDGMPLMRTKENVSDQALYWVMQEIVKDTNLTTQSEVDNKARLLLDDKLNIGNSGTFKVDGLPGLLPGYLVMAFDPQSNIRGWVTAGEVKHTLSKKYRTGVKFHSKSPMNPPAVKVITDRVEKEQERLDLDNENGLENTYTFSFDDDTNIQTHTNTETTRGKLVLQEAKSAGNMITDSLLTDNNVTKVFLKVNGSAIGTTIFDISNNGGESYTTIEPDTLTTLTDTGQRIKLKVGFDTPDTQIDSLSILYK